MIPAHYFTFRINGMSIYFLKLRYGRYGIFGKLRVFRGEYPVDVVSYDFWHWKCIKYPAGIRIVVQISG